MDTNKFVNRHVGISAEDIPSMLQAIGVKSVDELIDQTIPSDIRLKECFNAFCLSLAIPAALSKKW